MIEGMSNRSENQNDLDRHLEAATRLVRTWPVWKQTALGAKPLSAEAASDRPNETSMRSKDADRREH
jgi:hypothetical protein